MEGKFFLATALSGAARAGTATAETGSRSGGGKFGVASIWGVIKTAADGVEQALRIAGAGNFRAVDDQSRRALDIVFVVVGFVGIEWRETALPADFVVIVFGYFEFLVSGGHAGADVQIFLFQTRGGIAGLQEARKIGKKFSRRLFLDAVLVKIFG